MAKTRARTCKLAVVGVSVLTLVSLAACGGASQGPVSGGSVPQTVRRTATGGEPPVAPTLAAATVTQGRVSPNAALTPGTVATAAPDLGVPAQVEAGRVTISLSADSYAPGEAIATTISNGLRQTLYVEDSKSDCSIVTLERLEGGNWRPLPGCGMERLPLVVAIGPGRGRGVTINPLSTHFGVAPGGSEPAFGSGRYRIKFTYRLAPGPEGQEREATRSEVFHIRS